MSPAALAILIAAALFAGAIAGFYYRRQQYRPRSFSRYFQDFQPTIASHRGYGKHGPIAENTVPAFLASEKIGFRAHELDVRRTRDHALILLHGPRLENTTDGSGRAEEKTFAEIAALNAAAYLGHQPAKGKKPLAVGMPRLSEVFTAIHKHSSVNVEIKRDRWDLSRGVEELTLSTIAECGVQDRVFLSGFHFLTLWRLKRAKSHLPVGLLIEPGKWARFKLWLYRTILLPDNIHLHYTSATPDLVARLKAAGYGVACWTVNDPETAKRLFASGVDIVITDNMEFPKYFTPEPRLTKR